MIVPSIANSLKSVLTGRPISRPEIDFIASERADLWEVLYGANLLRRQFKGDTIGLCSIINAKSGACSEDCKFCAQSTHHSAKIKKYPLVNKAEIKKGYQRTKKIGAHGFSIVTSGNALSEQDLDKICAITQEISTIRNPQSSSRIPYLCGSLGRLTLAQAKKLKKAGLYKCHHNLETSERFFSQVCSTHSYQERIDTIKNLQKAGLAVCSGGIFGLGETWADRIDLALTLKKLDVDSVPLNFLIPVKGTTLQKAAPLTPREILRTIALFRYICPTKNIRICAGREKNLRDLQSWIFFAGADGMMIGGYLTQPGRQTKDDIQMLKDLGLKFTQQDV
ncbi:MAG: biotin synthase BioB [Planctomycetes bacterium]|nr:biotin synthase BioB [Planctomycetota bacterium]